MKTGKQSFRGLLKHKIVIQQEARVSDTVGGYQRGWSDVVTLWAKIGQVSAHERLFANKLQMAATHKFTVRYKSGIDSGMRIVFGERIFNIRGVNNVAEDNLVMEILAEENVA